MSLTDDEWVRPGAITGWIAINRWNDDGFMWQTMWAPNGCIVHSLPPKLMRRDREDPFDPDQLDDRAAYCECQVDHTDSLRIAQEIAPEFAYALGEERRPHYIAFGRRWRRMMR